MTPTTVSVWLPASPFPLHQMIWVSQQTLPRHSPSTLLPTAMVLCRGSSLAVTEGSRATGWLCQPRASGSVVLFPVTQSTGLDFFTVKQHICIYIYMYIYMYMCVCTYIYTHTYMANIYWLLLGFWFGGGNIASCRHDITAERRQGTWSFYILYTSSCDPSLVSQSPSSIHNFL